MNYFVSVHALCRSIVTLRPVKSICTFSKNSVILCKEPTFTIITLKREAFSLFSHDYNNNFDKDGLSINIHDLIINKETHKILGKENVFVVQPGIKKRVKKGNNINQLSEETNLALQESIALVKTLPGWTVSGHKVAKHVLNHGDKFLFGKKEFDSIMDITRSCMNTTALFISVDKLTAVQQENITQHCGIVTIYDRYTLVLQIFKLRAKTKEAKLQVALAELLLLKHQILSHHKLNKNFDFRGSDLKGESFLNLITKEINDKEIKIKRYLKILKKKRDIQRGFRKRAGVPIVAVVGYTNAGKTSLIKALAKSKRLEPENILFATLDVTSHSAMLPNQLRYVLVDTVGFLSNLPHALIDAFKATMEDMLQADLIVHVRDFNHPDNKNQLKNVLKILSTLNLESKLIENMIEVRNKMDLVFKRQDQETLPEVSHIKLSNNTTQNKVDLRPSIVCRISTVTGYGLSSFTEQLQEKIMSVTSRRQHCVIFPNNGDHLSWLHQNCAVLDVKSNNDATLQAKIIAANWELQKFDSKFGNVKVLPIQQESSQKV